MQYQTTKNAVMSVESSSRRISRLRPGETFTYYVGFIGIDRFFGERSRSLAIDNLAKYMLRHGCPPNYEAGDGTFINGFGTGELKAKRLHDGIYAYQFTKKTNGRTNVS